MTMSKWKLVPVEPTAKMKAEGDYLIFSSGRKEYANCCIIGLSANWTPEEGISTGYDSGLPIGDGLNQSLTAEEILELAEHMIAQWHKLRQAVISQQIDTKWTDATEPRRTV